VPGGRTGERRPFVLIRTGWAERQTGTVGFDSERASTLLPHFGSPNAEVAVVGADNFAVEVLPFAHRHGFPGLQRLIRDFGIPLA